MPVVSAGVDLAAVHEAPPFHESCTHIFGVPVVPSARASSLTSIPPTVWPAGTVSP